MQASVPRFGQDRGAEFTVKVTDGPPIGRPKTFDRDRVIDVAMESYWREGAAGVSLNEICRRAAVSKPGVYREFGGEDGLMDAVLERYAEIVLSPVFEQITHDRPFREVLTAMVEAITDVDRAGPGGCLLAKMQQSPSCLGPVVRARVDALRESARAFYTDWVDHAKERGEIPLDIPTAVAAALLDIQTNTLLMQMALGEDPELLRAQAALAFVGLTGNIDDISEPN
jgi:AcrR family transcriptional regulator